MICGGRKCFQHSFEDYSIFSFSNLLYFLVLGYLQQTLLSFVYILNNLNKLKSQQANEGFYVK